VSELDLALLMRVAHEVAVSAGLTLMEGFRTGAAVEKKGRIDLVTEWDLRSERLVLSHLRDVFPSIPIVAEETAAGAARGTGEDVPVWYVDPLDGTTNFAHGHPFFSVAIGLLRGREPLVGVVHAPAIGVTWTAAQGLGATRNDAPCRVSTTTGLIDALCATGFAYDTFESTDDNIDRTRAFLHRTRGFRRCGSAAMDLAMVSDGTYDLYWERKLKPWDLAAGCALILEASGTLSAFDGSPADPRTGEVVATNGPLHTATLDVLRSAG
jgi:myo-inositol-1(or 4)-monophosphatase